MNKKRKVLRRSLLQYESALRNIYSELGLVIPFCIGKQLHCAM